MRAWFGALDRLLRGEATRPSALRRGMIEVPIGGLAAVTLILAMAYGLGMGTYSLFRADGPLWAQVVAATIKVPLLVFLTLAVTFPSLYVFNALVGSRLSIWPALRLLVAALAVMQAVLASLGPIVAFFSVSTTSYAFMILLNVLVFAVAGGLGLGFLLQTLHRLSRTHADVPVLVPEEDEQVGDEKTDPPGPLDMADDQVLGRHVKTVFRCWVIVFGLVGAQMGWVLRPFLGAPGSPFVWFRGRESNFFLAVWNALISLFV